MAATLQKMQASFTWTTLHTKPEGDGWYSYQDLINTDSGVFGLLLETYQQQAPYLSKRQAVQNLFSSLTWWCATACYAPVLIDGRSPTNLGSVYFHSSGYIDTVALEFGTFLCLPTDEATTHSKATLLPNREALVKTALNHLKTMLQPIIEVAKNHTAIHDKSLWLYLADNLTQLVLHLKGSQRTACDVEVETVLRQLPERGGTGVLEIRHEETTAYYCKRSTCCFYYLSPEGKKCSTCPKLPLGERVEKLQDHLAKQARLETSEVAA
jgi:hypothetical protein